MNPEDAAGMISETEPDSEFRFKCGEKIFSLNREQLSKIPHLEALCKNAASGGFQEKIDESRAFSLDPIIYKPHVMEAIFKYISTGRERHLFTKLPEHSKVSDLFDLLDYLLIPKPVTDWEQLDYDLKRTVTQYSSYTRFLSQRPLARDTAVKLCWTARDLVTNYREQSKLDNMIVYILEKHKTFYLRIRQFTLEWYFHYFEPTPTQKADALRKLKMYPETKEIPGDKSSSGGTDEESYKNFDESCDRMDRALH